MDNIHGIGAGFFVIDKGGDGQIDPQDTVYHEGNGKPGLQESKRVFNVAGHHRGSDVVYALDHPDLFQKLGVRNLKGFSVRGLQDYVTAFVNLKQANRDASRQDQISGFKQVLHVEAQPLHRDGQPLPREGGKVKVALDAIASLHPLTERDYTSRLEVARTIVATAERWRGHADKVPSVGVILGEMATLVIPARYNHTEISQQLLARERAARQIEAVSDEKPRPFNVEAGQRWLDKQGRQLAQLLLIEERAPDYPKMDQNYAERLRITEEMRDYYQKLAAHLEANDQDNSVARTQASLYFDSSIALHKAILQRFPDFANLDEVMFKLGQLLIEKGKNKEGASYFSRLIKQFPTSPYLAAACFEVAEEYRRRHLFEAARTNYKEAIDLERQRGGPNIKLYEDRQHLAVVDKFRHYQARYTTTALADSNLFNGWNNLATALQAIDPKNLPQK